MINVNEARQNMNYDNLDSLPDEIRNGLRMIEYKIREACKKGIPYIEHFEVLKSTTIDLQNYLSGFGYNVKRIDDRILRISWY